MADVEIMAPEDVLKPIIKGDDEHPWPKERLRYRWSISMREEQDWPRQEMPPAVSDALAQIFARRLARDPHD